MSNETSNTFPGLLCLVDCNSDGTIVQSEGDNAEILASTASYTQQMAGMIGDAFGMEPLQEARLMGKNVTAACIPNDDGSIMSALFDAKANIDSVLPRLMAGNSSNELS